MTTATAEQAALEALLGAEGRAVLDALPPGAGPLGAGEALAVGARLRTEHPAPLVAAALTQRALRAAAAGKFSRAAEMWFTREGLEQASSERMARRHAERFAGLGRLADLCSGIGGDLVALARDHDVTAVDTDPLHLRLALANAAVNGVAGRVTPMLADAVAADLGGVAGVWVDPARRRDGRRLPPGTSLPPLAWCLGLAERFAPVGIKAAPGLPTALVPDGWEVEFVAEGRELKEAALWSPALATAARRATLLPSGETMVASAGEAAPVAPPGAWLLDPSPAVTRAGLVAELARRVGAWQVDPEIAFLSADEPARTPFARTLRVVASLPWQLKRVRAALRELGVGTVEVRKRGSAVDVDDLRRRLRLDGDGSATVVLTRVLDRPWALICVADG